ncbi:MAG: hypothetical protein U9O86_05020 [Campylobacterota bacterium]|nr:hypothetical protein [Campylobacterota bacterium]
MNQTQPTREKILDAVFKLVYINAIYQKIKAKLEFFLSKSNIESDTLADHIIQSVWGALSLSPEQSSKKKMQLES